MATSLCLTLVLGCDESSAEECPLDLPVEWECAQPVPLAVESVDLCAQIHDDPVTTLMLSEAAEDIGVVVSDAVFRQEQEVCAYLEIEDDTAGVLLQPCEMHPESTIKASCVYDFAVELGDLPTAVVEIEVARRNDFMSDEIPPVVDLGVLPIE